MKNLLAPDYTAEVLVAVMDDGQLHIAADYTKLGPLETCEVLIRAAGIIAAQHGKRINLAP